MKAWTVAALCLLLGALPASAAQPTPQGTDSDHTRAHRIAELRRKIEGDNRNNPAVSIPSAEEALRLLKGGQDPATELWFLRSLIRDLALRNDFAYAMTTLERARAVAARTKDPADPFRVEVQAGELFLDQDQAMECKNLMDALKPRLEAFTAKGAPEGKKLLGLVCRQQGDALGRLGLLPEAILTFTKAQQIFESIGDLEERARVFNQMGRVYRILGRLNEAKRCVKQAIAEANELGNLSLEANFRLTLADTYAFGHEPDLQLAELLRAGQLAAKAQDADVALTVAVDLSDVYLGKHDYRTALREATLALRLAEEAHSPVNVYVAKVNLGIAQNRLGNSTEGLKAIQESLEHFRLVNDKAYLIDITAALAEECAFSGDYRRAYENQLALKALTDEADQKRIGEASAAFERDKQEEQIAALQRDQRNQARLRGLWIAMGALGFTTALGLVIGQRKLKRTNATLESLNENNLGLIEELGKALSEVKTLQGLIPICSYCKKIRDDGGVWGQMEQYIQTRSQATFSHGVCPSCEKRVKEQWRAEGILPQSSAAIEPLPHRRV